MSDTKELIERLREMSLRGHWPLLGYEAADTIARLEAERDAVRREAMETCYQRVMAEGLDDPQLGTSDDAYEAAIRQAMGAIRAAMQERP